MSGPSGIQNGEGKGWSGGQFSPLNWRIHRRAKSLVFEAWGEIDLLELPRFQEALLRSVSSGVPFILDLRGVTYLELRALSALEAASARSTQFVIVPSKIVRRIIEVLELQKTLTLQDSLPLDGQGDDLNGENTDS